MSKKQYSVSSVELPTPKAAIMQFELMKATTKPAGNINVPSVIDNIYEKKKLHTKELTSGHE